MPDWLLIATVAAALLYVFANGWSDSGNAIATVVSTRVLSPLQAVLLAGAMNLAGAFYSHSVARTMGAGLVDPQHVSLPVVLGALLAALVWNLTMVRAGLPVSAAHALVGGLLGAAMAGGGFGLINEAGLSLVLLAMLLWPLLGGFLGWLLTQLLARLLSDKAPAAVSNRLKRLHLVAAALVSFGHGSGGAQRIMGLIALALLAGGYSAGSDPTPLAGGLAVPLWATLAAAAAMGLGTLAGGWRLVRSAGPKLMRLQPVHGFAAEAASASLLLVAAGTGIPVSSVHTMSGSVLGVGMARGRGTVRWAVTRPILYAWVLTLPGCALLAWLAYNGLSFLLG